jgi:hypothetical protein
MSVAFPHARQLVVGFMMYFDYSKMTAQLQRDKT